MSNMKHIKKAWKEVQLWWFIPVVYLFLMPRVEQWKFETNNLSDRWGRSRVVSLMTLINFAITLIIFFYVKYVTS